MLPVRLRHSALRALEDICVWYAQQEPGLELAFQEEFQQVVDRMSMFPEGFPVIHHEIRRALLRRFPYEVFYKTDGNVISVLGVLHAYRDPSEWPRI